MDRRSFLKSILAAVAVASPVAVAVEALAPPMGYINLGAAIPVLEQMHNQAIADIIHQEDREFLRCLDTASEGH